MDAKIDNPFETPEDSSLARDLFTNAISDAVDAAAMLKAALDDASDRRLMVISAAQDELIHALINVHGLIHVLRDAGGNHGH